MSLLPPILLVDDSADDRELLTLILRGAFGEVVIEEATDAASLARLVTAGRFGAVLTEHELPWIRSVDVLRLIHDLHSDCPVLVVTHRAIEKVASEIVHLAPDGLIPKNPSGLVGLPRALREALLGARRRTDLAGSAGATAPRKFLDAIPAGLFAVSAGGTIEDANPAFARLLGFAGAADSVQRSFATLFVSPTEPDALLARLSSGESLVTAAAKMRRADGSIAEFDISLWFAGASSELAPRHGPGHALQGMLAPRRTDAGEPAHVAARSDRAARAGLDELTFAVSHDLRKPLTQVVRFLDLLAEETAKEEDEEESPLLAQARASAAHLEAMVDAVLRLAKIESADTAPASVDMNRLLKRVARELEPERAAAGARIDVGPLPTLEGDEAQLEILFRNLLDNALKFRGALPPEIRIDAESDGELAHFRVQDNGIGVPARDAERIFELFQRLHSAGEAPGTGIGLALARRIVTRHGGQIRVEARPGGGSTFLLSLRRHSPANAPNSRGPLR